MASGSVYKLIPCENDPNRYVTPSRWCICGAAEAHVKARVNGALYALANPGEPVCTNVPSCTCQCARR